MARVGSEKWYKEEFSREMDEVMQEILRNTVMGSDINGRVGSEREYKRLYKSIRVYKSDMEGMCLKGFGPYKGQFM